MDDEDYLARLSEEDRKALQAADQIRERENLARPPRSEEGTAVIRAAREILTRLYDEDREQEPEQCHACQRTIANSEARLLVFEDEYRDADGDFVGYFCSWRCLGKWATEKGLRESDE